MCTPLFYVVTTVQFGKGTSVCSQFFAEPRALYVLLYRELFCLEMRFTLMSDLHITIYELGLIRNTFIALSITVKILSTLITAQIPNASKECGVSICSPNERQISNKSRRFTEWTLVFQHPQCNTVLRYDRWTGNVVPSRVREFLIYSSSVVDESYLVLCLNLENVWAFLQKLCWEF